MAFRWWADCGLTLYSDLDGVFQVFDGDEDENPLGKFCGEDVPAPLVSTGSIMTVIFHSDGSVEKAGFNATYEEIDGKKYPFACYENMRLKSRLDNITYKCRHIGKQCEPSSDCSEKSHLGPHFLIQKRLKARSRRH